MVTTRGGRISRRRNQETREDGGENQPQLIDESNEKEEIELSIVPYESVGEEDGEVLATVMERDTEGDYDDKELDKPEKEEEITKEGVEEAQDSPSESEIDLTKTSVEKQMKREDRLKRVRKKLGLPPPKRAKKTGETSTKSMPAKSSVRSKRFISSAAQARYEDFLIRDLIEERLVNLEAKDEWGYLALIKNSQLAPTVSLPGIYVKEVVCEFYANLPGEVSKGSVDGVKVMVRKHEYDFSPKAINFFLGLSSLTQDDIKGDIDADTVSKEKLAEFLSEKNDNKIELLRIKTVDLSPRMAALMRIAAYNWFPSSHQNYVSEERARIIYKLFHEVKCDFGKLIYDQIMGVRTKDDNRKLIFPRIIFGVLMSQKEPRLLPREKTVTPKYYKRDKRSGAEYLEKMKEKDGEAEKPSTTSAPVSQPVLVTRQYVQSTSAPVTQPASGDQGDQSVDIVPIGNVRVPRIGQNTSENSYDALVDTARALHTLTQVVQRLINNQNRR